MLACVTTHAADADLTLFKLATEQTLFMDTEAQSRSGDRQLIPLAAMIGG